MSANPNGVEQSNSYHRGQSLVQIYVHFVFSTKGRKPFLKSDEHRERLHAYLSGICKNRSSPAIIVGGVEDHVHLLCRLGKTIDIAKLILELKKKFVCLG